MSNRRNFLHSMGLLICFALTSLSSTPALAEMTKLKVQLAWLPNASNAGEIVAAETGIFEKYGLEVEFMPGGPASNPVQEVLSGTSDISFAYAPQIMYAVNSGLPVMSFAATFQKAPLTFYSLAETNIKSVKDWTGKRIGAAQSAIPQVKAVLAHHGMKFEDITFVQAQVPGLLQGQVDAVASWPTNVSQNQPILTHPGGYNTQSIWDNGLQFQSNYLIVRKDVLAEKGKALSDFLSAVSEGWAYAADNQEKAIEILVNYAPALEADKEAASLAVIVADYIYTDETETQGFGNISADRWQKTLDSYAAIGEISADLKASDVFDDSILKMADRAKR